MEWYNLDKNRKSLSQDDHSHEGKSIYSKNNGEDDTMSAITKNYVYECKVTNKNKDEEVPVIGEEQILKMKAELEKKKKKK